VKLTREPAPRLTVATRVTADDATYFGPFPSVQYIGDTVTDASRRPVRTKRPSAKT
jgi:excinuclease UvrABC nuclease subunit